MNKLTNAFILSFWVVLLLAACKQEDPITELKPILRTNEVKSADTGLLLSGEFILGGTYSSISYGFILSEDANSENKVRLVVGQEKQPGKFSFNAHVALKEGVKYTVQSWAKSARYEVLGNKVEWTGQKSGFPVPEEVIPQQALVGDTVKIIGKNFDYMGTDNHVFFGATASSFVRVNCDTLWAVVPVIPENSSSTLSVSVEVLKNKSLASLPFSFTSPVISGINKTEGHYPDTIVVTGSNFSQGNSAVVIGGVSTEIFDVTRNSFSFVVPYLKTESRVKVELKNFNQLYPVTENFDYHGQALLNFSAESAWLGDTLTLYAKNTDFRRICVHLKNANTYLPVLNRWNDSLQFQLTGENADVSQFELEVQFANDPSDWLDRYSEVDRKLIPHRPPVIDSIETVSPVYGQTFRVYSRGCYWFKDGYLKVRSVNGTVNENFYGYDYVGSSEAMVPGSYQLQLFNGNRVSNIKYFRVQDPVITTVSPVFNRGSEVLISGTNLPYYGKFRLTHLESGRVFYLNRFFNYDPNEPYLLNPVNLFGKGTYQLDMLINQEVWPGSKRVTFNDYFSFLRKTQQSYGDIWNVMSTLVANNNFYIFHSGGMIAIDLTSGAVRQKQGEYIGYNQPIFCDGKAYMTLWMTDQDRFCLFDPIGETWNPVNLDQLPSAANYTFGIYNNQLIAVIYNSIYRFDGTWHLLWRINNLQFYPGTDYIYSANGKLYFFDVYEGIITVISGSDGQFIKKIPINEYYNAGSCYFVEKEGNLYFWGMARSYLNLRFRMFSSEKEQVVKMDPEMMEFNGLSHFAADGLGNAYYINSGYLYQFNP